MRDPRTLTDEQLIELLFTAEDRLGRAVVDEILGRKERMTALLAGIVRDAAVWTAELPDWWASVHAVYLLGAIGGPGSVTPLLKALRHSAAHENDWVAEDLPSIFGSVGLSAAEGLKRIARDETTDWYARALAIDGLEGIAVRHPETEEDLCRFCHGLLTDEGAEREVRAAAGNVLLDLLRAEYLDDLTAFGEEERRLKDDDRGYRVNFDDGDVRRIFERGKKELRHCTRDWLAFYDDASIRERQLRWAQEDRKHRPAPAADPFVSTGGKTGRNDLCSCGSGRKYKKCCGLVH